MFDESVLVNALSLFSSKSFVLFNEQHIKPISERSGAVRCGFQCLLKAASCFSASAPKRQNHMISLVFTTAAAITLETIKTSPQQNALYVKTY